MTWNDLEEMERNTQEIGCSVVDTEQQGAANRPEQSGYEIK